jgi:SHS2 domain-containing protein
MPYEEIPHTADWSLRVWANDLENLFIESAKGMNSLAGIRLARSPHFEHTFSATAMDAETLLVRFLSELSFLAEHNHLAFNDFCLKLGSSGNVPFSLQAKMKGAKIKSIRKIIKAVTFHDMKIISSDLGFEVQIVFDV